MHYFVDGYNLLFRSQHTQGALQKQRDRVIADILEKVTVLELDITLVFDSACTPGLSTRQHIGPLEIIYTNAGETADTFILGELSISKTLQRQTVITSDKPLAEHARRLGAKTMNVESFLTWLQARYHRRRGKHPKNVLIALPTLPAVPPRLRVPAKVPEPVTTKTPTIHPIPTGPTDYLHIFETRLKDLTDSAPIKTKMPTTSNRKKTPNPKRKPQAAKEAPESDSDRWLRLFERGTDPD